MSNVQATLLCNGFTVLTLPVDGEAIHVSVSRDTKVNRSACCQTLLIRPLANIELKLDGIRTFLVGTCAFSQHFP